MKPQSHEDFRASVCIGCHKPGSKRKVTVNNEQKVQDKIFAGFSLSNTSLPYGLCNGCQRALLKEKPFPDYKINYENLKVSRKDLKDDKCACYICEAGRNKKTPSLKRRPGPKSNKIKVKNTKIKICSRCKQRIGLGIPHPQPCSVTGGRQADNILKLTQNNNDVEEKLVSSAIQKLSVKEDGDITLKTKRGRPLRLRVKPSNKENKILTHEAIDAMKVKGNMSEQASEKVSAVLRKCLGRNIVQGRHREKRRLKSRRARDFLR